MTDVVRGQIAYPEEPMPANLVDGQDADAVAIYIARCAGNPKLRRHGRDRRPHPETTATATTTTTGRRRRRPKRRRTASRSSSRPAAAAATP